MSLRYKRKKLMDTKAKSKGSPELLQGGPIQATSKKVFSRGSEDAPSPEYANNVEFSSLGMDIFMDVGTVAPESVREAMESDRTPDRTPPTVRFFVDFRFGMSLQSAHMMHQKLTAVLQATVAQLQTSSGQGAPAASAEEVPTPPLGGKDAKNA
jgi:hypothetical protein